jgi:hypothetical protein
MVKRRSAQMSNKPRWVQVGQIQGTFLKWTEKGQECEGHWRGQKDGQYGPLGVVDTAQGRVTFPLHTALLQRVESIKEGAEVRIVYLGIQQSRSGREFKAFDVFVGDEDDLVESQEPF